VITLLEKGQDFDITYIDLANKPDWFLKISPFGKVPVLRIEDEVVFESAVINEHLDEVTPPSLHPQDPLKKAQNRSWIEFSSQLNMDMFMWSLAQDEASHDEKFEKLIANLQKLEDQLGDGPFFNGTEFMLVDAAFAPFFMRLVFLSDAMGTNYLESFPKCSDWSTALLAKDSVQKSVIPTIKDKFLTYIDAKASVLAKRISEVGALG
jgi:glutathione S-transferase